MPHPTIALCYGTRPQTIKASALRKALMGRAEVVAIDTGQHYDYALNELLYHQLAVEPPDLFLEVGSASHAEQTALILTRVEEVLMQRRPAAAIVIGDTNSTLGSALAAVKLRIPVVHVEAGLRAQDALMAEEINRRAVDAVATILCTPCREATDRMRAEHPGSRVAETGDVSYDVLLAQRDLLPSPGNGIQDSPTGDYIFCTLHRAELTDQPELLAGVLEALERLDAPVVLAVHPRTRAVLDALGIGSNDHGSLRLVPAVGYIESLALARAARAVVTDSGGLQREAYWLGTPCITVRSETEWIETIALGANRLVSPAQAPVSLGAILEQQLERWAGGSTWDRTAYGDGAAAPRIAEQVLSLVSPDS